MIYFRPTQVERIRNALRDYNANCFRMAAIGQAFQKAQAARGLSPITAALRELRNQEQESMQTYLFVGGPKDGQRIAVDLHDNWIEFPVFRGDGMSESFRYREMLFAGDPGELRSVFALDGLSRDDVIQRLLDCYRPPEPQLQQQNARREYERFSCPSAGVPDDLLGAKTIRERQARGDAAYLLPPIAAPLIEELTCSECHGTGQYRGLHAVEPCRGCQGRGTVA